jgi:2-dehydro-3-deoxygalactonokinase
VEAPYLPCPAGVADLASAIVRVPYPGARVRLVPGLSAADEADVPEVMRGEETQLASLLGTLTDGLVCLPGSHSKWARIANGRITGFATHLTGETFAALRGHTILGRLMRDGPDDLAAFDRGVARAAAPGGLLHHLFGVRTLGLVGRLAGTEAASYLSGLLIGHEVRAAAPLPGARVHVIGATALCALYARAIAACAADTEMVAADAAARGLALIGGLARWN